MKKQYRIRLEGLSDGSINVDVSRFELDASDMLDVITQIRKFLTISKKDPFRLVSITVEEVGDELMSWKDSAAYKRHQLIRGKK